MADPLQELLLSPGSCPAADRPAGLSAADLHACLNRIRERSNEVKAKVRSFVTVLSDRGKTVDDVTSLSEEIPRLMEMLLPGVSEAGDDSWIAEKMSAEWRGVDEDSSEVLLGDAACSSPSPASSSAISAASSSAAISTGLKMGEISKSVEDARRIQKELRAKEEAIEMVEMVVSTHEVLMKIDDQLIRGAIVEAARAVVSLERTIKMIGLKGRESTEEEEDEEEQVVMKAAENEEDMHGLEAAMAKAMAKEKGDGQEKEVIKEEEEGSDEKEEIRVLRILQREFSTRKTKLEAILEELFRRGLIIDRNQCELTWLPRVDLIRRSIAVPSHAEEDGSSDRTSVSFGDILDAFEILGYLGAKLAGLADTMFARILDPVLKDAGVKIEVWEEDDHDLDSGVADTTGMEEDGPVTAAEVQQSAAEKHSGMRIPVLCWRPHGDEQVGEVVLEEAYLKILSVIRFIRENVMGGKIVRMGQLGRILWPRLADAIIRGPLGKAVPNKTSELADFQKVADLTAEFEQSLVSEGLISIPSNAAGENTHSDAVVDDGTESINGAAEAEKQGINGPAAIVDDNTKTDKGSVFRLSTFAANVDLHFAVKKRKKVLVRARDLLMRSDFAPVVVCNKSEIILDRSLLNEAGGVVEGCAHLLGLTSCPTSEAAGEKADGSHCDPDSVLEPEGHDELGGSGVRSGLNGTSTTTTDLHDREFEADENGRFFLLEKCRVTVAAKQLVLIAHEAMEEACISTERTAMELYHAARDALLLYKAIVPVKHAAQLSRSALLGMLFYNDCLYIAHHLMTMGIQYRQSLPPPLRRKVVFVDMVHTFQMMAEDTCAQHIQLQHSELMKALDQGNGFRYTDDQQHFRDADSALRQAVDIQTRLAEIWRPILSKKAFLRIMGAVMDGAVARLVADVISLQDMAEEETVQLRSLLSYVVKTFRPLLGLPPAYGANVVDGKEGEENHHRSVLLSNSQQTKAKLNDGKLNSGGEMGSAKGSLPVKEAMAVGVFGRPKSKQPFTKITEVVPSWKKLVKLIDLLALHLIPLAEAWESGELVSSGFTQAEVINLVEAIFSETAVRKDCLMRIRAADFHTDGA